MQNYNEEGLPNFTLPGVTTSTEEGDFGTFSAGMGPVAPSEGRLGGGGWAVTPMSFSAKDSGIWAESPAADDEMDHGEINVPSSGNGTAYGVEDRDMILDEVKMWDAKYMASRIG